MWFKLPALVLGVALLAKGLAGLVVPGRFYAWRRAQFSTWRVPGAVWVSPSIAAGLAVVTWSATTFHAMAWNWVVPVTLTLGALAGFVNLARWPVYRKHGLRMVTNPALHRKLDCGIVVAGCAVVMFAITVY